VTVHSKRAVHKEVRACAQLDLWKELSIVEALVKMFGVPVMRVVDNCRYDLRLDLSQTERGVRKRLDQV